MGVRAWALAALLSVALCAGGAAGVTPVKRVCRENPSSTVDDVSGIGPCKKCSEDGARCLECWEFYSVGPDGECVRCETDNGTCLSCNGTRPSFCLECLANFEEPINPGTYASANGSCVNCPKDCLACSSLNGTCTECERGTGLVDGRCLPCDDQKRCEVCSGSTATCTKCANGWSPDAEGRCSIKCPEGCATCSSPTTCTGCASYGQGWDEAAQACVDCRGGKGCTQCTRADACTACDGYYHYANATRNCVPCASPHCSSCDGAPDKCTRCSARSEGGKGPSYGVDLPTGDCVECEIEGCTMCDFDATRCWGCGPGLLLADARGPCKPCAVERCSQCAVDDGSPSGERCYYCVEGYQLSEDGSRCVEARQEAA